MRWESQYFHTMVLSSSINPKSSYSNRDGETFIKACVYICVHFLNKQGERHADLHNTTSFVFFCFSCALMDTNTHRHTDSHTYTHVPCYTIIVQEGGNRCPFRLRKRWAHSLCLCAIGQSWNKHLSTITISAVSKHEETQKDSNFQDRGSWCKNMTTWHLEFLWLQGLKKSSENKHLFLPFFFFLNILVLSELECREGCLLSNGVPGGFFPPELSL